VRECVTTLLAIERSTALVGWACYTSRVTWDFSWLVLVIAAATSAGCLESKTLQCPLGQLCPAGTLCHPTLPRCVTGEESGVCAGAEADTLCDSAGMEGSCVDGICLAIECGNGATQPGEDCDDANFLSGDGCSSACAQEIPVWQQHPPVAQWPVERLGHGAAYDPLRGRTVMFGGDDVDLARQTHDETWEWDGTRWLLLDPQENPGGLTDLAMSFDGSGVIIFGGTDEDSLLKGETWRWDGSTWTFLTADGPAARRNAVMAFDAARGRVVLFGGYAQFSSSPFEDTWEWDGAEWQEVSPTGDSPPARHAASMTFDEVRGQIVLYAGFGMSGTSGNTGRLDA
jgi:cysteine-rich repeat protein